VRGFNEQGTTTTPFDMVVLNGVSRYHLCILAMQRAERVKHLTPPLIQECKDLLTKHASYIRDNLEDMPEVQDWVWTE
jgi:xylulose-5-phosphate/fructose-6-phosphate phosphoketolase